VYTFELIDLQLIITYIAKDSANPIHFCVALIALKCQFHFAVNTKVDMRFNVKEAHWLGERIKERILQIVKKPSYLAPQFS
jgi:hypothetical protein